MSFSISSSLGYISAGFPGQCGGTDEETVDQPIGECQKMQVRVHYLNLMYVDVHTHWM